MSKIWHFIRKPCFWRTLLVVNVFFFNLLMGHSLGTTAAWTFFATIFAICICTTYGKPSLCKQNAIEKYDEHCKVTYGSSSIPSFGSRKKMRGY
jgi:hypothetical protein